MLFKEFNETETCIDCGKRLADIASGKVVCRPCVEKTDETLALTGFFGHLKLAAYLFFSFDFLGAIVETVWAIQRVTGTGVYGENGSFTRILKNLASK